MLYPLKLKLLVVFLIFSSTVLFSKDIALKDISKYINPKKLEDSYYKNSTFGLPKVNIFKDVLGRQLLIYQASFGGDGEHTENILKIFQIQKNSSKKLLEKNIEFVEFIQKDKLLKSINGKYVISLCYGCDGWDAALLEDVFFVPVRIDIKSMEISVELSNKDKEKLIKRFDKQSKKDLKEQLSYENKDYKQYVQSTRKYLLELLEM